MISFLLYLRLNDGFLVFCIIIYLYHYFIVIIVIIFLNFLYNNTFFRVMIQELVKEELIYLEVRNKELL